MKSVITILLFAAVAETTKATFTCGKPHIPIATQRIVGGGEARIGSLPWMALLSQLNYPQCGGAILNPYVILTAAHCFDNSRDLRPWRVLLGKHHLDRYDVQQRDFSIRRIIIHETYDSKSLINDVALVVLPYPVRFSSYISPVCLPKYTRNVAAGKTCLIAGWGDTQGTARDNVLNQVYINIMNNTYCSNPKRYGNEFHPETTFCAGALNGGKDSCQGDSGSPFVCNISNTWYVQGITSWGYGCAEANFPGVYSDIAKYYYWIRREIAKLKEPYCSGFC